MADPNELVPIGIPSFDKILGGGLRRGTICLLEELEGESSGVTGVAGMAFLLDGIKRGDGGILLLSEHTVKEYRDLPGTKQLLKGAKPKQFYFMDALSSMTFGEPARDPSDDETRVIRCSNVRYTAKFYEELRNTIRSLENPLIYVDSLSVLLHAMESDRVAWRFWLSLLPLIRYRNVTIVASFYPEMHSTAFVEGIERICDSIVEFTTSRDTEGEITRYIHVMKNRGLTFDDQHHPYTIEKFIFHIEK